MRAQPIVGCCVLGVAIRAARAIWLAASFSEASASRAFLLGAGHRIKHKSVRRSFASLFDYQLGNRREKRLISGNSTHAVDIFLHLQTHLFHLIFKSECRPLF